MRAVSSFFEHFFTLTKKDARLYSKRFLSMILTLLMIIVGCAAALTAVIGQSDKKESKISLALVNEEDSNWLSTFAVEVVKSSDIIQGMFDIVDLDSREEAIGGVENGEYASAIILSKNFVGNIVNHPDNPENTVSIILSKSLENASYLVNHFAKTGEQLIKVAVSQVDSIAYPLVDGLEAKGETRSYGWKRFDALSMSFGMRMLGLPENAFTKELPPSGNLNSLTTSSNYVLAFAVFILLLIEIIFFPYTANDCKHAMLKRIKSYGISGAVITAEKAVMPFITRCVIYSAFAVAVTKLMHVEFSVKAYLFGILTMLLISVLFSSLSVLFSQTPLGISILFAISVTGLFLSGGLVPPAILPEQVLTLGTYTPSGLSMQMLLPTLGKAYSVKALLLLFAFTAIMFSAASLFTRRICERGGADR